MTNALWLFYVCMYIYCSSPCHASWVGVFSCDFSSKLGKVEVEGQLKEKERSVSFWGAPGRTAEGPEEKGAQIGCLGFF